MATKNAATFDGANDHLATGGALTGAANSKLWTVSFWFKRGDISRDQHIISSSGAGARVRFRSDNTIEANAEDEIDVEVLEIRSATANTDTSGWHHYLMSLDMSDSGKRHIYVDDSEDFGVATPYADEELDFTKGDHSVGATTTPTGRYDGCLSELWNGQGVYFDFSDEGNRRKFISSDLKAVDLGSDGSRPNGTAPIIYLANPFGTFELNLGAAPEDYSVTGALTDCTGPTAALLPSLPIALFAHAQRRSTLLRM